MSSTDSISTPSPPTGGAKTTTALLRVIRSDAGILLASLKPEDVLEALDKCPAETLKADPFAILVLMRRMFTWRQIPKMLELKALLLTAIEEHPETVRRRSAATCWANATSF